MACPDARSIPETAGHDDQPLQSSIGDRQFGCSGANADAVESWPRYWAHSRIARRSRRRNARWHSCSSPCPTNQCATRIDVPAGRTRNKTWALSVCAFAIGRRRYPECCWQSAFAVLAKPPGPAVSCPAAGSERAGQTISANWMRQPVGINCKPGCRRHERTLERPRQNGRWKMPGNALVRRAIDRRFLFSFSSCHLDMLQDPTGAGFCATEPVKPFSTAVLLA